MAHDAELEEQIAAAIDLLTDHNGDQPTVVERLKDQYSISTATAWRRVKAAREQMPFDQPTTPTVGSDDATDYGRLALEALAESLRAAQASGDHDAVAERATALANAVSKLKIRWA